MRIDRHLNPIARAALLILISWSFACAGFSQNTPPVISTIANRTIGANLSTPNIAFTIGDLETPASNLTLSGASTNTILIPVGNIVFGGAASNRTVQITPTLNQIGRSLITVTVTDGGGASASRSFLLTVTNSIPGITYYGSYSINVLIPSPVFALTIGDRETSADNLTLTAASANPALLPATNIVFGGAGSNRTVQFFPLDQVGTVNIALSVNDSLGGSATNSFPLTIFNSSPVISGLVCCPVVPINAATNFPITVADVETPATNLAVVVSSSNTNLLPNENLILSGAGTNRLLSFIPATNKVGTTTITAVVADSLGAKATNSMNLSIYQFVETGSTGLPGLWYSSAAWGDFDNDGLLDLALIGNDPGLTPRAYIFHNNGDGTFSDIHAGLPGVSYGAVAWGDYDNDGYVDLLLSGSTASDRITRIYHNNRDGTFSDINAGLPGLRACAVAWGDYDNDGLLDLVLTGSATTGSLTKIYRNNHGQFVDSGAVLPALTDGSVAWGDYDNDGDLDLLLTGVNSANGHFTLVLRNQGGGVFTDINAPLKGLKEGSAAWGDFDNDGDLDILVTGSDATFYGFTALYRNDGNDTFTDLNAGLPGSRTIGIAWGDYDNDGLLDIAFGLGDGPDTPPPQPPVYRNVGGAYQDSGNILYGFIDGMTLWADYDGDGRVDVLNGGFAAVYGQGVIATKLFRNYGPVTNTPPTAPIALHTGLSGSSIRLSWSSATDANQSGGLTYNLRVGTSPGGIDVVTPMSSPAGVRRIVGDGNVSHNLNWMLRNLPPGTYYWSVQAIDHGFRGSSFAPESSFVVPSAPTVPSAITEVATGVTCIDALFNGFCNPDGLPTTVLFLYGPTMNYGSVTASRALSNGTIEQSVQIAAVNLTPATTYHVRLLAYNAAGTNYGVDRVFTTPAFSQFSEVPIALPGMSYGIGGWGDFDNDGRLDLFLAGYTNGLSTSWNSFLLHNDGNASFSQVPNPPTGTSAGASLWDDFDNDGHLDLLLSSGIYRNIGNGTFSTSFSFPDAFVHSLNCVDYDNDGRQDVYFLGEILPLRNLGSYLYHNDGQGNFARSVTNLSYNSGLVSWGDFDNDGDLDVFCLSASNTKFSQTIPRIFRNNGGGVFSDLGLTTFQSIRPSSMAWSDFDNDGFLDVALIGTVNGTNYGRIYRNNGNGSFSDSGVNMATLLPLGIPGTSYSLQCGDYDNDGQLDLLVAGPPNSFLLRNLGNWNFVNSGIVFSNTTASLFLGDYDGDGDLDIVAIATYDGRLLTRLFRNNNLTPNSPPNAPTGLQAAVSGGKVLLSWNRATDSNQTNGFGYNLRVGTVPRGIDVMSPLADLQTGQRRTPKAGNAGTGLGWYLANLSPGPYYWSVQAIDHSLAGSAFANEATFTIPFTPPVITGFSYSTNGAFNVRFTGYHGGTYSLQGSSDMLQWATIATVTLPGDGAYQLQDPLAASFTRRFYRLGVH